VSKYYWTERTIPDTKLGRKLYKNQIVRIDSEGITIKERYTVEASAAKIEMLQNLLQYGIIDEEEFKKSLLGK
jgi:hypothetical protein